MRFLTRLLGKGAHRWEQASVERALAKGRSPPQLRLMGPAEPLRWRFRKRRCAGPGTQFCLARCLPPLGACPQFCAHAGRGYVTRSCPLFISLSQRVLCSTLCLPSPLGQSSDLSLFWARLRSLTLRRLFQSHVLQNQLCAVRLCPWASGCTLFLCSCAQQCWWGNMGVGNSSSVRGLCAQ